LKGIKILHITPQNFAGVPIDFVRMHRSENYYSRLVTFFKNTMEYDEDICLNLPFRTGSTAKKWRDYKYVGNVAKDSENKLKYYKPYNFAESIYFVYRDFVNKNKIEKAINEYDLLGFDVYHFDGGMDFFRDCRFAKKIKRSGKKIVCCYYGSDLRTRGIFKDLDEISDLNLTIEFDHLKLKSNIHYLFLPFDVENYKMKQVFNSKIKIVHSPTNRLFKGTDKILKVIEELKEEKDFEFILLEGMNRKDVLKIKSECDLAIDQVGGVLGGSGYGKNSLENISMGVPTITEFTPDYLRFLPENPFIHSNINDLKEKIISIIDNPPILEEYAVKGRKWVEKYHSFKSVNVRLTELYLENNIIQ